MVLDGMGQMRGLRTRFQPAPIVGSEISNHLDELEMPLGEDRRIFRSLVKAMDKAFRAHCRRQDKLAAQGAQEAQRPGETRDRPTFEEQEASIARIRAEKAAVAQKLLPAPESAA